MARPRHENPTPAELEVLRVIWERGSATVREIMGELEQTRPRAYTSVMSLMNVMADKGFLKREENGRAYIYSARAPRDKTLTRMVGELLERAFDGSASALVTHLLEQTSPSSEELVEIEKTIAEVARKKGEE
jgi:BlaI family penicillinase repressor